MRVYHNMPARDFIYQLRDIAIRAGARPLVIDAIDELLALPTEDANEFMWNECYDALSKAISELKLDIDSSAALREALMEVKP